LKQTNFLWEKHIHGMQNWVKWKGYSILDAT